MTSKEGAIITAYTGILIGSFSSFHEYAEGILGRPIFTHEFGVKSTAREINEKSKNDFLELSKQIEGGK
jgi:hypothetical protein